MKGPARPLEVRTAEPLLLATGLRKRYGGVVALNDATLSAVAGEVHALLGENGAGKSTFVKMLSGAVVPDAGRLQIGGSTLTRLTPATSRALGVAAVFQELSLVPVLTGAENIWFPREPVTRWRTRSRTAMLERAEALLDEFELPHVPLDVPVGQLSIAQRQLVEIAKAAAARPKILVLDEATSALGPQEVEAVHALARRIAQDGGLCIFISHRLAEVRAVADRLTIFRGGATVASLDAHERSDAEIVRHIAGRRLEQLYPERRSPATGDVVLSVHELTAGHQLRGVDFELRQGEIVGVGGLQGQGQLQLFLRLFGAARGKGRIEIGGREVQIRNPRHALSAGVGCALIPEDRKREGLLLDKPIRENLVLAQLHGISRNGIIRRSQERVLVDDVMRRFGVAARDPEQLAGTLSGGNQQKIVIGKFMLPGIRVMLCYDPTRGVDVGAKQEIFELMRTETAAGRAVLFFSTDADELLHVCDRILVFAGGKLSAELSGSQMTAEALTRGSLAMETEA